MTQWLSPDEVEGGRPRGLAGLATAWARVLVGPRGFFADAVVPGAQAPALVFAVVVAVLEESTRFVLVPDAAPVVAGLPWVSAALALLAIGLLVTPAVLHLVAAIQTLVLVPFAPDRGRISETVQVIAYASAPCVVAGVPHPMVRLVAALWGTFILAVGVSEVHDVSLPRAELLAAIPAALVFGYGFRGFAALETVLQQWYVI